MSQESQSGVRRLGIVVAMDQEFNRISAGLTSPEVVRIGPRDFLCAEKSGLAVVCVRSRIGKVAAASTATSLINQFGVDAIVFTGVAGGVTPHIGVGDLVVADALMQYDIDLKGILKCNRFDIPLLDVAKMPCSRKLFEIAISSAREVVSKAEYCATMRAFSPHLPKSHVGVIASGDTFINSSEEREELLRHISDLACVEMEGGAVAQVCLEHGVPFVVCRVISDSADGDARLDFEAFLSSAASIGSNLFIEAFVEKLRGA